MFLELSFVGHSATHSNRDAFHLLVNVLCGGDWEGGGDWEEYYMWGVRYGVWDAWGMEGVGYGVWEAWVRGRGLGEVGAFLVESPHKHSQRN